MTHLDYDWETPVWRHWLEGLASGPQPRALRRAWLRACPTGTRRRSTSTRGSTTSRWSSTPPGSTASRCSACPRARRWPSPTRSATPSGSPAWCSPAPTPAAGWCGPPPRRSAARPRSTSSWPASAGAATTRRSARCSPRSSSPTARRSEWAEFNAPAAPQHLAGQRRALPRGVRPHRRRRRGEPACTARRCCCTPVTIYAQCRSPTPAELAALIPGSRLVPLDSRNHLLTDHEPAWPVFLRELDAFLGRARR